MTSSFKMPRRWAAVAFCATMAMGHARQSLAQEPSAQQSTAQQDTAKQAAPVLPPNLDAKWHQELGEWRAERAKVVSAPDGWLTLAGLFWLKPGVNTVGSAADSQIRLPAGAPEHLGMITVSKDTVQLLSPNGGFAAGVTVNGKPAWEGPIETDGAKPSTIAWHGVSMTVTRRGGRYTLRMKDTDAPARVNFKGLNWYEPDARFLLMAKWTPYTPPHVEKIPTVLGNTIDLPAPGVAEFTLNGTTLQLEPVLEDPTGKTLFFILKDATNGVATYAEGRYLRTGLPDNGLDKPGLLTLDFNRLENPPCAYTANAVCPLAPPQNRLPAAIEAGEKLYAQAQSAPDTPGSK